MPATLDPDLRLALDRVALRLPAPDVELEAFRASASKLLPDDYVRFLRAADGGEGWIGENYIQIASAREAAETTRGLERFVPGLFFFGGDGAAALFAFDLRDKAAPVVITHTDDLDLNGLVRIAESFSAFVRELREIKWIDRWVAGRHEQTVVPSER
jgi:hypothetical protein